MKIWTYWCRWRECLRYNGQNEWNYLNSRTTLKFINIYFTHVQFVSVRCVPRWMCLTEQSCNNSSHNMTMRLGNIPNDWYRIRDWLTKKSQVQVNKTLCLQYSPQINKPQWRRCAQDYMFVDSHLFSWTGGVRIVFVHRTNS